MTDQELLQQAKDQVAVNASAPGRNALKSWEDMILKLETHKPYNFHHGAFRMVLQLSTEAALLAIQRAREEAYREGYFESGRHMPHRYSKVHKHDCSKCGKTGVSFCNVYRCEVMEKIINPDKKLTAPGR